MILPIDIINFDLTNDEFNKMLISGKGITQFNLNLFKYYSKKNGFREVLKTLPEQLTNKILIVVALLSYTGIKMPRCIIIRSNPIFFKVMLFPPAFGPDITISL